MSKIHIIRSSNTWVYEKKRREGQRKQHTLIHTELLKQQNTELQTNFKHRRRGGVLQRRRRSRVEAKQVNSEFGDRDGATSEEILDIGNTKGIYFSPKKKKKNSMTYDL